MTLPRTPLEAWAALRLCGTAAPPSPEALQAAQLARLRETFAWAARKSPLYRQRLASKAPPASLADLAELPFTTARDLGEDGECLLCVSQDEIRRVVTLPTSGTTGPHKRLRFTAEEQEAIVDFFRHGMSTLVVPGDRVLILLPGQLPGSVGALLATALEQAGATPLPYGWVRDLPAAAEATRRLRPTSVVGAPVQVLALQRWAEEVAGAPFRPRTALLTTDHVPEAICRRLRATGVQVFEHYGMTEMGLGGAVDCAAHAGYHLREPDLLFEVVDPASGRPVPEGGWGEVVFTTLTRRGMPLIRYRTGDLSRLVPGPCPCGTALRRLSRIRGRTEARAVPCGRGRAPVALPELDEALFAVEGLLDFAARVDATGPRPSLSVTAFSLSGDRSLARAASEALRRLPALGAAEAEGALALEVLAERLPDQTRPDPRKRMLAWADDSRGPDLVRPIG
ncbi:MAG TPA: AMP-binding protein [Anaeromyxobacter sp.]|nr:AMP-binding protein [Anaeromyxobacter sp.]